jgi:cyclase
VSVNSSAIANPHLISELANRFGSQCITLAIDTKLTPEGWKVFTRAGTVETPLFTVDWASQGAELGAGEILLTSMNNDGTKNGFALDITRQVSEAAQVPVIASGGAGTMEHFVQVFEEAKADAALAASIFHFREIAINDLKKHLSDHQILMR